MRRFRLLTCSAALLAGAAASCLAQPCTPYWTRVGGVSRTYTSAIIPFDDGTGTKLYVGGGIYEPKMPSYGYPVSRWDGTAWQHLGNGIPPNISGLGATLRVLDDGGGPRLCLLGRLTTHERFARRWDGKSWVNDAPHLHLGVNSSITLTATISYDDGGGPAIYGETVNYPGFPSIVHIVRWDGGEWVDVGSVGGGSIGRWAEYDAGDGNQLYVLGQNLHTIGGVPVRGIARWDGAQWGGVGGGVTVRATNDMCVYDAGSGPELYVAQIEEAGGLPIHRLGRWNGTAWSNVGAGFTGAGFLEIYSLEVFDDGSGPALFVAGLFSAAGGVPARDLAKWDGHKWSAVFPGIGWPVWDMAAYDDGRGESLFLGGDFETAGGGRSEGLVQYVGCASGNCYADCDRDGILTLADFSCFQAKYQALDPYANCNLDATFQSSNTIGINLADFGCFQTKFAQGCP